MKKSILFAILCVICSITNAQEVTTDEVTSDGSRMIAGEMVYVTGMSDKVKFEVGLFYYQRQGDSIGYYSLAICPTHMVDFHINKGMKLLLKDKDGNVIELNASDDTQSEVKLIGSTAVRKLIALYDIDEETIRQLSNGVTKMRMEYSGGAFDKEWKKDKMGAVLRKELSGIRHKARIKKDFYSDF